MNKVFSRSLVSALGVAVLAGCGSAASGGGSSPASAKTAASSAASSATPKVTTVKVVFAATQGEYGPFLTAINRGYYQQAGIKVVPVKAAGSAANAAVISGSVPLTTSSASAMTAILKGLPMRVIEVGISHAPYYLVTKTSVTSPKQLIGQRIAVQAPGDTYTLATDFYLESNNISPTKVAFIPVGYDPQPLYALESGAVDASVMVSANIAQLDKSKYASQYHVLASYKRTVPLGITGVATSTKFLAAHPNLIRRFLEATFKGALYYQKHPNYGEHLLETYNPKFPKSAEVLDYKDSISVLNPSGVMSTQDLNINIKLFADYLKVPPPSISKVYALSLAQQAWADLQKSGWKP